MLSKVCVKSCFDLLICVEANCNLLFRTALSRVHRNEVSIARVIGRTLISNSNLR